MNLEEQILNPEKPEPRYLGCYGEPILQKCDN